MSEHKIRISNGDSTDIGSIFRGFIQTYGITALDEPRRLIAYVLDMDSRKIDYAKCISKAYHLKVPEQLKDCSDKAAALNVIKELSVYVKESDIALHIVEAFCEVYGKDFKLRPDYSSGEHIPYKSKKGDGLATALDKLDHIRWFLNHSENYQWNNDNNVLEPLRKLMNLPEENKAEIENKYKEIVHEFHNNPYETCIAIDEKIYSTGFTSNQFSSYFIVINDEPIAMEFARYHGGDDVKKSKQSWDKKEKVFKEKIESFCDEIITSELPDAHIAQRKVDEIKKYIIWSCIWICIVGYLCKTIPQELMLIENLSKAKLYRQNILILLWKYQIYENFGEYGIVLVLFALTAVMAVVTLCSMLLSIMRYLKAARYANAKKRIDSDVKGIKNEIIKRTEVITKTINYFYQKESEKGNLKSKNYVKKIKSIEEGMCGSTKEVLCLKSVPQIGGKSRLFTIIGTFMISILSFLPFYSYAQAGAKQLNSFLEEAEVYEENYITPMALTYKGHYYCIFYDADSWEKAKTKCEVMGGNLVKITTKNENDKVCAYLKQEGIEGAYIGLKMIRNKNKKEKWYWVTGEKRTKVKFKNWTEGEPDIGNNGKCVYGACLEHDDFKWRAVPEAYLSSYICEWREIEDGKINHNK